MRSYLEVLETVVNSPIHKANRTGTDTKSRFSVKFRHDMQTGFPLLTTKKIKFESVAGELFGFLTGQDTVAGFQQFGCNIWKPWGLKHEHYAIKHHSFDERAEQYATSLGVNTQEAKNRLTEADQELESINQQLLELQGEFTPNETAEFMQDERVQNLLLRKSTAGSHYLLREAKIPATYKDVIYPEGYLGPIYGQQWIAWRTSMGDVINQLRNICQQLDTNPFSRRIVLLGWNPEFVPRERYTMIGDTMKPVETSDDAVQAAILDGKQALPPCHLMSIFTTEPSRKGSVNPTLNLHTTMRSTDAPIGLPYNIASYGLLLEIVAHQFGMDAGELVIEMVDCHIYEDQIELAKEQLTRTPGELPKLKLPADLNLRFDDPESCTVERLQRVIDSLEGYEPQAFIPYPVAV